MSPFILSIAAEVPAKGKQHGTELMLVCEGAEGLRDMLLNEEQTKYNSDAMEAFYVDQNAKGGIRR